MDNYEEKYKSALKWMQSLYGGLHGATKEEAEKYFPELKENKDDKIREKIMNLVKKSKEQGGYALQKWEADDMLDWLEKQGKQDSPVDINKMVGEFANAEVKGYGVPSMIEVDAYRKGIEDVLEKQSEQEPYGQRKKCSNCQFNYAGECKGFCQMKRDGQKSVDKVEPKFHEGNWVVWDNKISCHVDKVYQGEESLMYTITDVNNMIRSYDVKSFDNNARLWTIQDAKDGDVLVDEDNNIGLYLEEKDDLYWHSCIYLGCDDRLRGFSIGGYHNHKNTHPATKEQRDLLFQKMTDAGYEWDSVTKELERSKKPENKKNKISKIEAMLEFDAYQNFAFDTAICPTDMRIIDPALGLAGETGEVVDKIKKVYRDNDKQFDSEHKKAIAKELGDVLWYVANIATDLGYRLSEIAQMNVDKINSRKERNVMHGEGDER